MNWIKDNKLVTKLPDNCFGFVYLIENITNGKKYIGKKQAFSLRKKKFGKRKLAEINDKRLKKYEMIRSESNWQHYTGSNKELNEDIKNGAEISKTILEYAYSKAHLTYLEIKYQFMHGVIESDNWYNSNISGRYYPNIFEF